MFDLPNRFWYILAITVFVVINFILWLRLRYCKQKGIKPKPAFGKIKKHKKRIVRWTDIFIITVILLETIHFGYIALGITTDIPPEYKKSNTRLILSVDSLMLLFYSASAITIASLLSPFQNNITLKKRLILFVMCCIPLVSGILYCIFDNLQDYHFYFKLLLGSLFPIVFINWSAILLGQPFVEFFSRLLRKIPLPYFQTPKPKEREKE